MSVVRAGRRSGGRCYLGDFIDSLFCHFKVRFVDVHCESGRGGTEGISCRRQKDWLPSGKIRMHVGVWFPLLPTAGVHLHSCWFAPRTRCRPIIRFEFVVTTRDPAVRALFVHLKAIVTVAFLTT